MSDTVIPANAGVILTRHTENIRRWRYPRECGGDPVDLQKFPIMVSLSPRMRG